MPTNQPIVLLKESDGTRYLPIWVGAAEATAIAYAQQGIVPPRPLTHDLLVNVIEALGHTITEIRIDAIVDNVFHAVLVFDHTIEVSARASDAIALALRLDHEIVGRPEVVEEAGVIISEGEDAEDEVEKFREFLDQISPEDFEGEEGPDRPASS
ncbi:hypothetical protein GCM10025862_16510 [Arsenicicoccus piscis]|uniref:BFN domain-containing protein n=2 Tax=Arsenicicoccus piscis TaxID=673954 RepID=A0ABQ6HMI4_9MICO|nr:bifunctional nuclease family protein [Arsenicicoccus piscis]GMA19630.1 hypothetical protein GCM10025862_16510 [Arsenicicoccus piscis]